MVLCNSKPSPSPSVSGRKDEVVAQHNDQVAMVAIAVNGETFRNRREEVEAGKKSPFFPFYNPSPAHWGRLQLQPKEALVMGAVEISGQGKMWGHTCNAIKGGKLLYNFGGYDKDNCQTNQVNVFDSGGCS